MPKPELYVIYTGDRKSKPTEVSFSEEFFGGEDCCIDVKVKMIYDGKEGDIINQYVVFTKVCSEQIAIHGRTKRAILEAIHICKDKNVLKEYLESKEKEVVDIMMVLYDEQEVMRSYIESEVYEGRQEGRQEEKNETAKRFLEMEKFSFEEIAKGTGLTVEEIKQLAELQLV